MHILSKQHHIEFCSIPELVRFTMAHGSNGLEPTLLVKTLSLSIKYMMHSKFLRLFLVKLPGNVLGYGVTIDDDHDHPGFVWSVMEKEDERNALLAFFQHSECTVFLFNELVVSTTWAIATFLTKDSRIIDWVTNANLGISDDDLARTNMSRELDEHVKKPNHGGIMVLDSIEIKEWTSVRNTYITSRADTSLVSFSDNN